MIHATQPKLCQACEIEVHTMAETGKPGEAVIKTCRHAGDNEYIVAMAATHEHMVVSWITQGPMPHEQARMVGMAFLEQASPNAAVRVVKPS